MRGDGSVLVSAGTEATFPSCEVWLDPSPRPGFQQMAIDTALLERARQGGGAVLRLYRWFPHCLSFGRHEPALRRYDRALIEERELDVVRRPTGGRAVWHADELTYSLTGPSALLGSLRQVYTAVHQLLADALAQVGVPATLAARPASPAGLDQGACFSSAAGGEVVAAGRKLVGSAQVRREGAVLQHGSVLLSGRQDIVAEVTRGKAPPRGDGSVSELVGGPVSFERMARAIVGAIGEARMVRAIERFADGEAVMLEAEPYAARFRDPAWTWLR